MARSGRLILTKSNYPTASIEVGSRIKLNKEDSHYIRDVLRFKEASSGLSILIEHASILADTIIREADGGIELEITSSLEPPTRNYSIASLSIGLLKGEHMDIAIEKACELGVPSISIWGADRSVVQLRSKDDICKKVERWNKIARSACQQSLQEHLTSVNFLGSLESLLSQASWVGPEEGGVICSMTSSAKRIMDIQRQLPRRCHLFVGPEGDLSTKELEILSKKGMLELSLGTTRFRSETAAITAIVAIQTARLLNP